MEGSILCVCEVIAQHELGKQSDSMCFANGALGRSIGSCAFLFYDGTHSAARLIWLLLTAAMWLLTAKRLELAEAAGAAAAGEGGAGSQGLA